MPSQEALVAQLDREFGANAVARGRAVFAETCARCHSSQPAPWTATTDFRATVEGQPDLRVDFLSNERPVQVTEVGTSRSRALHSNHMKGHVWEEYGSETLRARPPVDGIAEPHDGGRGYYRPISLLSVWAFAPFMHNNAIGPEVCGKSTDPLEFYRSPYVVRGSWMRMPNPPPCVTFDPSVEGRYRLFKASVEELLNPSARLPKITLVDQPIIIDGPIFPGETQGFQLQIPAGIPAAIPANLRHKELIGDLVLVKTNVEGLRSKYASARTGGGGPHRHDASGHPDSSSPLASSRIRSRWCHRLAATICRSSSRCTATAPSRSRTRGTRSEARCLLRTRRRSQPSWRLSNGDRS